MTSALSGTKGETVTKFQRSIGGGLLALSEHRGNLVIAEFEKEPTVVMRAELLDFEEAVKAGVDALLGR